MQTITALTVQKRHPDRVSIFLDDAFAFGLPFRVAETLRKGQQLSPEEIEELKTKNLTDRAKNNALHLISLRPRSIVEIERRLQKKEYNDATISQVIAELEKVELLDDAAFARFWVEQRETFKPRSRIALSHELRQKGVARDIIELALADLDEMAMAETVARKKAPRWAHLPQVDFRLKLGRFLQQRGFHYGIIKPVVDNLWQEIEYENEGNQTSSLRGE